MIKRDLFEFIQKMMSVKTIANRLKPSTL